MRLISESQYVNTIRQVFGEDIALKIRFAPVKRVSGLVAVGASTAVVTPGALDMLDASARSVAAQVVDEVHRSYLFDCEPADATGPDPACARDFLSSAGRLLYRRPLSEAELSQLVTTAGEAATVSRDFYSGVSSALSGMLVSAQFLYMRERAEPDPGNPLAWRLDGYSKASRLAFLLWNASPDDELLAAAESGKLHTRKGLRREIDRMIASPLYVEGVRAFFRDFFVLEAFDNLAKDSSIYPAFTLKAVQEAREQVLLTIVDHLVTRGRDYRDLFSTRDTFLSSELAVLYRVPVNVGSLGWVPYEVPADSPRAGLLTQIGFLAQFAHPGRSSPTRRGRAVREILLCQPVPDPPPNVDFSNFEDPASPLKTARERLNRHQENPVCAGCHAITDPIGLSFENFDGAGQFRESENGAPISAAGTIDGTSFPDAAGLGEALRDHPALSSCIVERLQAYATGFEQTGAEVPLLDALVSEFEQNGFQFDAMLRRIIMDPGFFAVKPMQVVATRDSGRPKLGGLYATQD